MSEWKPITPTSPTEEECKRGVIVGWRDGAGEFWAANVCSRLAISPHQEWWIAFFPPPRPDPAKEAFREWWGKQSFKTPHDGAADAWHAALAWAKEEKV
jgi:hypothetical protein